LVEPENPNDCMPEKKRLAVYDLPRKRTGTIGVMVHKLDSHSITSALPGIQKVIMEKGYDIIITHSQESIEKEIANTQLLFARRVDGVLVSPTLATSDTRHFTAFIEKGVPVVFFGRAMPACGSGRVMVDNTRCGYLATEHLIRQGCRRISVVTSALNQNNNVQQYRGFREALKRYGLTPSPDLLITENIETIGGADIAQKVMRMDPLPDGLFIPNDQIAVTCIHHFAEAGIRVPEDIAIVGFNNDPAGRLIMPALTTIDYPGFEIGRTAASTLLYHRPLS
jgi:LacI family transcriptional regulator